MTMKRIHPRLTTLSLLGLLLLLAPSGAALRIAPARASAM